MAYADNRALHERLLPFCGSARTWPHTFVCLEGVKTALTADAAFERGRYDEPPTTRLRALARVCARWSPLSGVLSGECTWSNATRRWFAETPCAWPRVPCTRRPSGGPIDLRLPRRGLCRKSGRADLRLPAKVPQERGGERPRVLLLYGNDAHPFLQPLSGHPGHLLQLGGCKPLRPRGVDCFG